MKCEASRHCSYMTDTSLRSSGRKGALTGRRPCGLAWTGTSVLAAQPGRPRLSCHGRRNAKRTTRTEQPWSSRAPRCLLCSALMSQSGGQSGFRNYSHFKFPHQIVCRKGLTKMWKSQTHTVPYTTVRFTRQSLQLQNSELKLMHTGFSLQDSPASWKSWPRNHACTNSGLMAPTQAPGNLNQSNLHT